MALNCERRGTGDEGGRDAGEPCGECLSCQRIWGGSASLDVVEIDAASNRGVDDARELRERAMYSPSSDSGYKVYIIDEAHMLTREAWNALLKVLEEPPPRVVFVFATTEPQKIAQAATPVLSRLQRFDLKRIGAPEIRARLNEVLSLEGLSAEPEAIAMIARAADGSMRDALSLTDQVLASADGSISVDAVRDSLGLVAEDEYIAVLDIIVARDARRVFPAVERLADEGIDFTLFLSGVADLLRALLAFALGSEPTDISERTRQALLAKGGGLSAGDLIRMINMIAEVEPRFRKSTQQRLLLETLLVRFALLDRTVELETVFRALGGGAGGATGNEERSAAGRRPVAVKGHSARALSEEREQPRPTLKPGLPPLADKSRPAEPQAAALLLPLDMNHLVEQWDDVVDRLRRDGRGMLASHLASALPTTISSRGVITVQLDDSTASAYDLVQEALNAAQVEVIGALRAHFSGVEKVVLAPLQSNSTSPAPALRRLTEEAIRAERLASLRKKDPILDAAVRELDLELLD
jgi:DNA polymerase-3 subunit gamma/tau